MTSCFVDHIDASWILLGSGLAVLVTALYLATTFSGTPLKELGLRPKGSTLWSWFFGYFVEDVGIHGYDCILGALSPPLRVQCHLSAVLFLWGVFSLVFGNLEVDDPHCALYEIPKGVWRAGAMAVGFYGIATLILHHFLDGVSMPGGPRVFRLLRRPQWKDQTTLVSAKGWKCLVADESHRDTNTKFDKDGKATLTGEAAGRQIWSNTTTTPTDQNVVAKLWKSVTDNKKVDQGLIQTMAMGGRTEFGFNPAKNPNSCDMLFRAQQIRKYLERGGTPPKMDKPQNVQEAAQKAAHFYSMLQSEDGHWAADYGGPHFLMPGMVTAWYVMGKPSNFLDDEQVKLLEHYIRVHQQTDGGWGTHIESPSTMFGSTLMYVALRLLGVPKDDPAVVNGRDFLKEQGGALYTSSWSKFYLCLLGCMDWKGHNSVPPEMWLLPNWFPFHPGRMWCHARMVYLPMGYIYGSRFVYPQAEEDPLIASLREELYCEPYESIDWVSTRHWVADMDNYSPIPLVMKVLQNILARYENWSIFQPFKNWIRAKGLTFSMDYMQAEDLQTNYIDIGPVNKVLNTISHYHGTSTLLGN